MTKESQRHNPTLSLRWKNAELILLSFLIPLVVMLIALAGLEITPFGDNTLVISDANGLYINTLSYAGRMLKGLEGVTYSFEKGLGGNMMGHLNGILLTPFAFLFSFTDIVNYPMAFTFVSAINFSLAGLAMYLLLAGLYGHKQSNLIFSTSYALMGFQVANVFQAYFFSAAPILPIMVLGLRKLFQGKPPLIYILSIAYALFSNAYFGFMLCVASALFFTTGLWYYRDALKGRRAKLILNYAISSICAGLLSAAIWLPAFLSLRGGRLNHTTFADYSFGENMPFLEIGAKLFTGANSTSELVDGLPNIFVGILPLALAVLFFISKRTDGDKKKVAAFLLCVYLVCFWITAFDILMHAGTTTNWFNYRYSYIFSFILLVIAADIWQSLGEIYPSEIKRIFAVLIIAALFIFSKKYEFVQGGAVLMDLGILALIFLAWSMYKHNPQKNPRKLFEVIALILVCVNIFLNYRICTKSILSWGTKVSDYQTVVSVVDPLVRGAKSAEPGFYRIEIDEQRSQTAGNDPMLYGYDGVGHGGSNERDFVHTALNKLGVPWYDMRNFYAKGVPAATDTLLGLRYIIGKDDLSIEKGYEKLISLGEWNLYRNLYALPIAFAVEGDIDRVETKFENVFDNLNHTWQAISGKDENVFIEEENIVFEAHQYLSGTPINSKEAREIVAAKDASISALVSVSGDSDDSESPVFGSKNASESDPRKVPENTSYISYTWTAAVDGPVYVYNKSGLSEISGALTPMVQYLGYYRAGDTVMGYIPIPNSVILDYVFEDVAGRFRAAYAQLDTLHELSKLVSEKPVTLEKQSETHLTGRIGMNDEGKVMFTIPWDEGWTCYVDGQKTELTEVLGVFMALNVSAGEHTYEMIYEPAGLSVGKLISLGAAIVTLIYLLFGRKWIDRIRFRKPRFRKPKEPEETTDQEVPLNDPI